MPCRQCCLFICKHWPGLCSSETITCSDRTCCAAVLSCCSCGGELSLVPLVGMAHGQVLTGPAEQQVVVVSLVEGLMEMLQLA